jgi:predicted Zn-dependent protease
MKKLIYIYTIIFFLLPINAFTEEGKISTIRDYETEKLLREVSNPVFREAGLDPDSVEIIIINDPSINAFVAGGQKVFIHTGLITESEDLAGLVGVIAHEAGHIKGAHLIQKQQSFENANLSTLAGYVLGLGSILAGAPPEAGIAISSASQNMALRNVLSYSRDYENAADTVAIDIMSKIGVNPEGLIQILEKLMRKQKISGDITDKYMLTHPISEERINYIRNYLKENPSAKVATPKELEDRFDRVKAKVYGFLYNPKRVREIYRNDNSDDAKYAIAITYHQEARFDRSMEYLKELLSKKPNDPFYNELKAQFLFESGKIDQSIDQYRKVVSMVPSSALINLKLASSLIARGEDKDLEEAISLLKTSLVLEKNNINALNSLGLAYGKMGRYLKSYIYLAESAYFMNNFALAQQYITKAESLAEDKGTQDYVKIIDLKNDIATAKKEK